MKIRTRITEEARARGFNARELARRLGWYPSNISLMDSGRRSVSLRALARAAEVLGCSPADLLRVDQTVEGSLFRKRSLNERLRDRDLGSRDGSEKDWVHTAQLAWGRHYSMRQRLR